MAETGTSWVKKPCWANGTRFDTVELMVEENMLDRRKALACFCLGETEYREGEFVVEFRMDDPDLESDRIRRTRRFRFPGWKDDVPISKDSKALPSVHLDEPCQ